jgi:hypothetical protein
MKTVHGNGEREVERQAAERLHGALCLAWKALYSALNGARVEERRGYSCWRSSPTRAAFVT